MLLPHKQPRLFMEQQQWFFGEFHGCKWLIVLNLQPIEKSVGIWVANIYWIGPKGPVKKNPIPVLRAFTDRFGRIDTGKIHKILGEKCFTGTNKRIKSIRRICTEIRQKLEEQFFRQEEEN